MTDRSDPFELPEWRALNRECHLVKHLISSGITSLGKANYASAKGEYYTAFFGLSLGIERLCKLVLVADYALEHDGRLPSQRLVRNFGHKIVNLVDAVEAAATKHGFNNRHLRPRLDVCLAILECLDSFADASKGRYANFNALANPNFDEEIEPIRLWWNEVAGYILTNHYRGTSKESATVKKA